MGVTHTDQSAPAFGVEDNSVQITRIALESALKLCDVEDPETEPFRSKYKAREALKQAKDELQRIDGIASLAPSLALINYRLGVISLAVEETSAAQEALDACADAFFENVVHNVAKAAGNEEDDDGEDEATRTRAADASIPVNLPAGVGTPCPLAWEHPTEAADTLTQLGLLWSGRGYPRRSILYLLSSVAFLKEASMACPSPEFDNYGNNNNNNGSSRDADLTASGTLDHDQVRVGGGTMVNDDKNVQRKPAVVIRQPDREEQRATLASRLTHGYYYLAQAYAPRDVEQAAEYCTLTLKRQLDAYQRGQGRSVSFDPGEWSRNACFLADYYAGLDLFPAAGRCLLAAKAVLEGRNCEQPSLASAITRPNDDTENTTELDPKRGRKPQTESTNEQRSPSAEAADAMHNDPKKNVRKEDVRRENTPPPPPPPAPAVTSPQRRESEDQHAKKSEFFLKENAEEQTELEAGVKEDLVLADAQGETRENNAEAEETPRSVNSAGNNDADGHGEEENDEAAERRKEQMADVDRHMAKLYITVLQRKHNERSVRGADETNPVADSFAKDGGGRKQKGPEFDGLGIDELPLCDPSTVRCDFESVRDVFKKAKSHTDRALRHYVLDGFVTAHVALHQGLSRAYLYLCTFEEDKKRRQAMCLRRAQSLEPLVKVLGPKAYSHLHKELSFELGEIYQDLAELKVARVIEKTESGGQGATFADVRATNKLLQAAIAFFSHFIAMYHNDGDPAMPVPADSKLQPRKDMEAAEAPGYLHARFMRARLYGKLQFADSPQTLQSLHFSRAEFTWLVENGPEHLTGARANNPGFFSQELELASEMVQLQSHNIDNLERKLRSVRQ